MVAMLGSDGVCETRGVVGTRELGLGTKISVSKVMEPATMRRVMGAGAWTSEDGRPWSNPTEQSNQVELGGQKPMEWGVFFIAFRSSKVTLLGPTKPRRRRRRRQPPSDDSLGWWHSDHPLMAVLQVLGIGWSFGQWGCPASHASEHGRPETAFVSPKWQGDALCTLLGAGNEPRQNDACGGGVPGTRQALQAA